MCYDTIYNSRYFTKSNIFIRPPNQMQVAAIRRLRVLWLFVAFGYVYIIIRRSIKHGRNPRDTMVRG